MYQIYLHNVSRKAQLKQSIDDFVKQQIKALRIKYDEETSAIEEYIDIEEESEEYEISKRKYADRNAELRTLQQKYKELKVMHVEGMMKTDEKLLAIFSSFAAENREVISCYAHENQVAILCKEKVKHRRGKFNPSQKKLQKKNSEEDLDIERGTSIMSSDDDEKEKIRFVIRNFVFYKSSSGVAFHPMEKYIELPGKDYTGLAFDPFHKAFILHTDLSFTIVSAAHKPEQHLSIKVDKKIIFCEVSGHKILYIGTSDGILRTYEVNHDLSLTLARIVACSCEDYAVVSHFCLSANPEVVLFVENGKKLCEMNIVTYSGFLLSELPEEVVHLSTRVILGKNLVYKDYYTVGGSRGKVSLQHNEKLKQVILSKKANFVSLSKYNGEDYIILDEGEGNFVVEAY